jgi:thioredoxin-related protein
MKAVRLLALLLLTVPAWAAPVRSANQILKAAEVKAGHEHKKVFLIFHASWCGWCHKLDGLLNSSEFKADFNSSYVIVHLTVREDAAHVADNSPGGEEMLDSLGGKDGGIPFFAFFDSKGHKLADSLAPQNIGYPSEPKEVSHFMRIIKTTSRMSPAKQAKLQTFLSKSK